MNERIRELAKAYLVHERYTRYGEIVEEDLYEFYPDELEKFAELIVQECADIAKHHVMNISTYSDAEFVEKQILENFGVK